LEKLLEEWQDKYLESEEEASQWKRKERELED